MTTETSRAFIPPENNDQALEVMARFEAFFKTMGNGSMLPAESAILNTFLWWLKEGQPGTYARRG